MGYLEEAKKSRSKKNILAILRSKKELKNFTEVSVNNYERVVEFVPNKLFINGSSVSFTLNHETKTISFAFVGTITSAFVVYNHYFSTSSVILPNDFSNGFEVEFEHRINSIGELKLELDYENTNIALETSSSIQLENTDGFFDPIFDYIWENQEVDFYSYFENLDLSEIKLIFKGFIETKSFNSKYVTFSLKDRFYKLRKKLVLRNFQLADGSFDESFLNKPMRRIYGKLSKLKLNSISQQKGIISQSGTISGSSGGVAVVGVGTEFLKYASVGDRIVATVGTETKEYSIKQINSDTSLDLSENITTSFSSIPFELKSTQPSKHYNRKWLVAGHQLHYEGQTIYNVPLANTVSIADTSDFEIGDIVTCLGSTYTIRSITGNNVKVNQNLSPIPGVGDSFFKVPVYKAYYGINELVFNRDYTLNNSGDFAFIELNQNAESNITPPKQNSISLTFTNGSRIISRASGTEDLKTVFKNRDLIKPNNVTYSTYYEILDVQESSMTIRTTFTDATVTSDSLFKPIKWIEDDSVICVDCVGKKNNPRWLRTAPDIVRDILINDAGYVVNEASFTESNEICNYKISAIFPDNDGDDAPTIKDCIAKLNGSVFGSLYYDTNYDFKYCILNSNKPEAVEELNEDDVLSYSVSTKNNIISNAVVEYRTETNLSNGNVFNNSINKTSSFVPLTSAIESEQKITTLIHDEENATTISERLLLFRSLSTSVLNIKAKLNLSLYNLNDFISVAFDRIYKRYGGPDKRKIGIITSIGKNESETNIVLSDMSNIFNRIPAIAPNSIVDLSTSSDADIAKYGFIVDNIKEVPDLTENYIGSNIIG